MTGLGLLVLRLALALVCVAHGAHKLFGAFAGPGIGPGGLTNTAAHFTEIGLNPGFLLAVLGGLTQFAGGWLVGVGLLTRYAAMALSLYFLIGFWKEHAMWGFFLNWTRDPTLGHGYEYLVVILGGLACLMLAGGGEWSLDGRRAASAESRAAGRARITRHG
jgi:putative oxidoreductase